MKHQELELPQASEGTICDFSNPVKPVQKHYRKWNSSVLELFVCLFVFKCENNTDPKFMRRTSLDTRAGMASRERKVQWTSVSCGHVHRRGQEAGLGEAVVVVVQHKARSSRSRAPRMRVADGSIFSPFPKPAWNFRR